MLSEHYTSERLAELLIKREAFHPYPDITQRDAWDGLPESLRTAVIAQGERYLGAALPVLRASVSQDYFRTNERMAYESLVHERRARLAALALAECVENRGRFFNDIVDHIWAICEETSWCVPAHYFCRSDVDCLPDAAKPTIDLFCADTASLLSNLCYLMRPALDAYSPVLVPRMLREIKTRVLDEYLARDDYWWMGFARDRSVNNWNPWINSNVVQCFLLAEQDEARRCAGVYKVLRSLDEFLRDYPADGGCDEGASYWGVAAGSLFNALELIDKASGGRLCFWDEPLIGEMCRYVLRAYIDGDRYVNFADCPARLTPDYAMIYRMARTFRDDAMAALAFAVRAQFFGSLLGGKYNYFRRLLYLFDTNMPEETPEEYSPFIRQAYLPDIEVLTAREQAGTSRGLFLAAKGGHNDESHNHNDVGSFAVFLDGKPFLIDLGNEEYNALTFSDKRYDIWVMQSSYHNLPQINGVPQRAGREYCARAVSFCEDEGVLTFSMELQDAYPAEAGAARWTRVFRLMRGDDARIEVEDQYTLRRGSAVLYLITPAEVRQTGQGLLLENDGTLLELCAEGASVAKIEEIPLSDPLLHNAWGEKVSRIILSLPEGMAEGCARLIMRRGLDGKRPG